MVVDVLSSCFLMATKKQNVRIASDFSSLHWFSSRLWLLGRGKPGTAHSNAVGQEDEDPDDCCAERNSHGYLTLLLFSGQVELGFVQ